MGTATLYGSAATGETPLRFKCWASALVGQDVDEELRAGAVGDGEHAVRVDAVVRHQVVVLRGDPGDVAAVAAPALPAVGMLGNDRT